jgi:hypothetical protein
MPMTVYNLTVIYSLVLVLHFNTSIFNASFLSEGNLIREWTFKIINSFDRSKQIVPHINNVLNQDGIIADDEASLAGFDLPVIKDFFNQEAHGQVTYNYLKSLKQTYATEQLLYLLETYQNNTLLVLSHDPLILISMNNPTVLRDINFDNERILLSRFVKLSQVSA